jgi:hypothetical protein
MSIRLPVLAAFALLIAGVRLAAAPPPAYPDVPLRTLASAYADAAYSPDGKFFVLAGPDLVLYDAVSRKRIAILNEAAPLDLATVSEESVVPRTVEAVAFSHDSAMLAADVCITPPIGEGGEAVPIPHRAVLYRVADGARLRSFASPAGGKCGSRHLAFSPDGKQLAVGNNQEAWICRVADGERVAAFKRQPSKPRVAAHASYAISADWRYLLLGAHRHTIADGSVVSLAELLPDGGTTIPIFSSVLSATGDQAMFSYGGNGTRLAVVRCEPAELMVKQQSRTGFSGSRTRALDGFKRFIQSHCLWTPATGAVTRLQIFTNASGLGGTAISPDGKEISVGPLYLPLADAPQALDRPDAVRLWHPTNRANFLSFPSFGANGILQFSGPGADRWGIDLDAREVVAVRPQTTVRASPSQVFGTYCRAHSPGMKAAISGLGELVYPKATGKAAIKLPNLTDGIFLDDSQVCTWRGDTAIFYDIATGETASEIETPALAGWRVNLHRSPTSRFLVRRSGDLMDVAEPAENHYTCRLQATAWTFSADDNRFAASSGKTVRVVETTDWEPVSLWTLPTGRVGSLAFSPDNRRLAVGNVNGIHAVVDTATGKTSHFPVGGWDGFTMFAADGKVLVQK